MNITSWTMSEDLPEPMCWYNRLVAGKLHWTMSPLSGINRTGSRLDMAWQPMADNLQEGVKSLEICLPQLPASRLFLKARLPGRVPLVI